MNVLLLGGGGREHAMAWKIAQSTLLTKLYVAPGNGGTSEVATNLDVKETDFRAIAEVLLDKKIQLLVVGPEGPLVMGIRDFVEADPRLAHVKIVGPGKEGAQLEGSKAFSKRFMVRHGIPTAAYQSFSSGESAAAKAFLRTLRPPFVIKADGLAAGKGVLILNSLNEAEHELVEVLESGKFGAAGGTVVIEEFLEGIELSVFILTDGTNYVLLPEAKDYKRIGEGDTGLNTGGMGSVSPVSFADQAFMKKVEDRIVRPTVGGLREERIPYCGFIFVGLMNVGGEPFVIEYNCRLGDPETENVLPRIQSDFLELLWGCASSQLTDSKLEVDERISTSVMLVSGGYPGDYPVGKKIDLGLNTDGTRLFHAGTKAVASGLVTSGGRVIAVNALADSLSKALELSYGRANRVLFEGMYCRPDIGRDLSNSST